jgi:hypothetical protein
MITLWGFLWQDLLLTLTFLLEGEPSPQSEVLSTLEQVFVKGSLYFSPFIFASIPSDLPVTERHPHSMMLAPTCFTVGMVSGFLYM